MYICIYIIICTHVLVYCIPMTYFVEHIYVSKPNDPAELFPLPEPGMQSQRPEEATMSGFPSAAWEFRFF